MGRYIRPTTIDRAVQALAGRPLSIVAGGTDIYPAHVGRPLDGDYLDLSGIEDLDGITDAGVCWHIGANVTWAALLEAELPPLFDGLKAAAREIGGWQVQQAATLVGNICNASPAADGVPALLSMDAALEIRSARGARQIPVSEFVLGNRRTALLPGEMVRAIRIPKPAGDAVSAFMKLGARHYLIISIVAVAGVLETDGEGRVQAARLTVGACSEVAMRLPDLEQALNGQPLAPDLARLVRPDHFAALRPIDDLRGSADYRRQSARVLTGRLLSRLGGGDA